MTERAATTKPARARYAVYGAGLFSLGLVPMLTIAVPLWALSIGLSPLLIGIVLGARSALSIPFSIHGGALMDRLGPRRIMLVCALINVLLLPLYPLLPWVVPLIALQCVVGFAQGLAWMGAQTEIALMTRREPGIVGRFTFVSTLGNLVGPPLVGFAWDNLGPWGAFGALSIWSAGIFVSLMFMPQTDGEPESARGALSLRDAVPRLVDYVAAFRIALIPAIGFVVAISFLMTSNYAVRHSFYTVYLESIGLTATLIGLLFASGSLMSSVTGLAVGWATNRVRPDRLLLATVTGAVLGMTATPLFSEFSSLFAFALIWGVCSGLAFPLTLLVLAREVEPHQQGMGVGIRTTVNRLAGFITPIAMGAVAEAADVLTSFLVVGGALLAALALLGVMLLRHPRLREG